MNGKQIFKISGICILVVVTVLGVRRFWPNGSIGKLDGREADELFLNSKISNDRSNKKEITGFGFFECLKKFLEKLDDHAINSACTNEKYDEVDRTNKGSLMKEILEEVRNILFGAEKAKEEIDKILEAKDAKDLTEGKLDSKEKAKVAFAKVFIYNLLKVPHNEDEDYKKYRSNVFEGKHVKKHISEVDKRLGVFKKVKVRTNPNDSNAAISLQVYELLYIEIYLISKTIPADLVNTGK